MATVIESTGAARRRPRPQIATTAAIVLAALVFAVLVYLRRWISDDGLILVRVARQIVEGYGPNYNFFERAEPNTSALWLWLVAVFGLLTRANIAYLAVILGGVLAVAGFVCAIDAARRLHQERSTNTAVVPCGALIVLGVFPFWDYATAGLETGMCFAWVSASYWLLVTTIAEPSRRSLVTSFLIGLGPLVRPDFALVSVPMLAALWWLVRPRWRRTLVLAAAALTLPLLYAIFRAGYYGTLVPLPALAKSAASAEWSRGAAFLGRFVVTYHFWLPLIALAALLAASMARRDNAARERVLIITPIVCGIALVIYIARVGGDFMHGRMLLVPVWLLVMPAMALPLRRWTAPVIVLIAGWALVAATTTRGLVEPEGPKDWSKDWDERAYYVKFTGDQNPIDPALFVARDPAARSWAQARAQGSPSLLIWDGNGSFVLLDPTLDVAVAVAAGRVGTAGATAPLDGIVVDLLGLANPLGARITITQPDHTGHEKFLPASWVLAEYADPDLVARAPAAQREPIEAARRALQCGELAELLASVREPMTPTRFWKNLIGAWRRTRLVVPADPVAAARRFCGPER